MFIAALFTIAKLWKQPDAPQLTNGSQKCGIYTQWNFTQPQKNEILSPTSKWMELENIILSEVSQAKKAKHHMFSLICRLKTQNKISNIIRYGPHTKGRMGGIGKGRKPKT
jgi:hypothetical protein